jgi:DNA polymerase-3 subunit gamma/tau
MFYLTYRPKTIAELDTALVREKLTNLLKSPKLPHALLFVGQKGMGKTSTARIFAKAINCLNNSFAGKGDSIEPCNTCDNCKAIDSGHSPDVAEMDAASNRGIDEIRNLIKDASFSPMICRYRVFIIDEAHMITTDAFNALLKTLEEPPEKVIFIMATTNEEKVPKTIASRAFRVNFGKANSTDIIAMLQRVLKNEKKQLPEDMLQFIASSADFSFRDATKMLEETLIQNISTLQDLETHFGMRSHTSFLETLEQKDVKKTLQWIHQFHKGGGNAKLLIEDILKTLQEVLMEKSGVKSDLHIQSNLKIKEISLLMKLLTEAYTLLKVSPIDTIPLEIAMVEFYGDN